VPGTQPSAESAQVLPRAPWGKIQVMKCMFTAANTVPTMPCTAKLTVVPVLLKTVKTMNCATLGQLSA